MFCFIQFTAEVRDTILYVGSSITLTLIIPLCPIMSFPAGL